MGRGQGQDFGATGISRRPGGSSAAVAFDPLDPQEPFGSGASRVRPLTEDSSANRATGAGEIFGGPEPDASVIVTLGGVEFVPDGDGGYDVSSADWRCEWDDSEDFAERIWEVFKPGTLIDVVGEDGTVEERLEMVLDPDAPGGGRFLDLLDPRI